MSAYTKITIHAQRVRENVQDFRSILPPLTRIFAILKADAYGLGAARLAVILDGFVDVLGVVTATEARELCSATMLPIVIFSEPLQHEDIRDLVANEHISFTVYTLGFLEKLENIATQLRRKVSVHLKINTGLNRLGVAPEHLGLLLTHLRTSAHIQLESVFTHLGFSDHPEHPENEAQLQLFDRLIVAVRDAGFSAVMTHALSTQGIQNVVNHHYDAVRIGLGLYQNAVTITAPVGYVHDIAAGEWVSYAGLYCADHTHKVAVVYAGYSAGIPSSTTGMVVLIHGKRYPVIGRVCMDLIMVALPQDSIVSVGDTVVLYGTEGDEAVTAEDWKSWAGLNPREIFCRFGFRAMIDVV